MPKRYANIKTPQRWKLTGQLWKLNRSANEKVLHDRFKELREHNETFAKKFKEQHKQAMPEKVEWNAKYNISSVKFKLTPRDSEKKRSRN